ncbi:MAG: type II toxin-antitoxin system mRNA interferase toxin, RelE/StbE family [bacterium]|nr:type II toxin-antitoxin system mRNA interferase toxin, RelE/StbE family [bacterium]
MLKINYTPFFIRAYDKLDKNLKTEIKEKIELLKNINNHQTLKVHKLHGRLAKKYSFYINYKVRIVFEYIDKNNVLLHALGDHDIYK